MASARRVGTRVREGRGIVPVAVVLGGQVMILGRLAPAWRPPGVTRPAPLYLLFSETGFPLEPGMPAESLMAAARVHQRLDGRMPTVITLGGQPEADEFANHIRGLRARRRHGLASQVHVAQDNSDIGAYLGSDTM